MCFNFFKKKFHKNEDDDDEERENRGLLAKEVDRWNKEEENKAKKPVNRII